LHLSSLAMRYAACYLQTDTPRDDLGNLYDVDGRRAMNGPEHAADGGSTLCGIACHAVVILRRLFRPSHPEACPACREAANSA
jgi:hypothetical protein